MLKYYIVLKFALSPTYPGHATDCVDISHVLPGLLYVICYRGPPHNFFPQAVIIELIFAVAFFFLICAL